MPSDPGDAADRLVGLAQLLSQVAKHSTEFAEMVVQQKIMPVILHGLADEDDAPTRACAAATVQEISRRTPQLAEVRRPPRESYSRCVGL